MEKDIQRIMIEFAENSFWGLSKMKTPDYDVVRAFIDRFALPHDYKELLKITDGFVLFESGDNIIYDMSYIVEIKKGGMYMPDFKDEMLDIGYFMGYELLINQNESHTDNYLYAGDANSYHQYVCVGSLTSFLNGFIDTKGEYFPFWEVDEKNYINFERE